VPIPADQDDIPASEPVTALPSAPERRSSKCCGKCAFKAGSPETEDGYGWAYKVDAWRNGGDTFFCHESIPGHEQEVLDDRPRWRTCAGWEAHRKTGFKHAMRRVGVDTTVEQVFLPGDEFSDEVLADA